jgi:phosphoribosylformylglycinamidine synthase
MKFGVVIFPGSNCDQDMVGALRDDLGQEVIELWHKDNDLSSFTTEDCIVLPGGFSFGDYLLCKTRRQGFWSLQWIPNLM